MTRTGRHQIVASLWPLGHGLRAIAAALLVAGLTAMLLPAPGGASELTDEERAELEPGADEVRATGRLVPPEGASHRGMWSWPEGGRAFFLSNPVGTPGNTVTGEGLERTGVPLGAQLIAADLDTFEEVGRIALRPSAFIGSAGLASEAAAGREHLISVDPGGARLFVPYVLDLLESPGEGAKARRACLAVAARNCVGGIHVVDASAMTVQASIPLPAVRIDDLGGGFMPQPRAVRYSPPREGEAGEGKVHLLVEDVQHHTFYEPSGFSNTRENWQQLNFHYVIQFDVATAAADWVVRVNACRGTRDSRGPAVLNAVAPAAVFRSPDSGDLIVGCTVGTAYQALAVRVPLDAAGRPAGMAPVAVGDSSGVLSGDPGAAIERGEGQQHWLGPLGAVSFYADPASGRLLVRANPRRGEMWWVFDESERAFVGAIGIGDEYEIREVTGGLDERTGRLYVLAQRVHETGARGRDLPGGLFVADIRTTPLTQALHYPGLAPTEQSGGLLGLVGLHIASFGSDGPRRLHYMPSAGSNASRTWLTLHDPEPVAAPVDERYAFDGLTLDLPEAEGVTDRTFDGAARGYGARALLVGGAGAAVRQGPLDPTTGFDAYSRPPWDTSQDYWTMAGMSSPTDRCVYTNREVVVAFSGPDGPAVVDGGGSRGGVQPLVTDAQTGQDAQAPVSRCSQQSWDEAWEGALVSQAPTDEPGAPSWPFTAESRSSCVSDGQEEATTDHWSDPHFGVLRGDVSCAETETGGRAEASGVGLADVSVTEAVSRFRVYLDPERGLVARVESIARGVRVGGLISIDTIRGTAESWANGRANRGTDLDLEEALGLGRDGGQDGSAEGPDGSEPAVGDQDADCDLARTAGTCFTRHFFGVTVLDPVGGGVAYSCGPCGDEAALVDALNTALGTEGTARLRNPDPVLARGADNGYIAAVVKPDTERFADLILNQDGLETVVPALEVIRHSPASNPPPDAFYSSHIPVHGRQVFQFAGVEVSSTYSIQCLLEYDPVSNVCAESLPDPASLSVELIDLDGAALAGGAFELRHDTDGDGVLGLVDELVEGGACATGPDGVCAFDGLEPGSYLVSQTAAPDGYAAVGEPLAVSLFPGDDLTVTFTNVPNVSTISLTVTDLDGAPVEGAVFGVFPDADYVAASASPGGVEPAATCTTDADGVCSMSVPPGAYVLRQLSAPDGLLPIDDIAFVISQAGQTADVALTLGAAGSDPVPVSEPAAGPVDDFAPPPAPAPLAQPAVSIAPAPARPAPSVTSATPPPPAIAEQVGGTIIRVIRSPANALRLAARSPIEAASLVMVLLLVGLAVMAVIRRQQLATLLAEPGPTGERGPGDGPHSPGPTSDPGSGGPTGGAEPPNTGGTQPARSTSPLSSTASAVGVAPTATVHATTAVLDRSAVVAGAAPSPIEGKTRTVVVATALPALAVLLAQKLAVAEHCELLRVVDSLDDLRAALAETSPDVLVLDLALPTGGGYDVCDLMPDLHPPERTVGLIPPNRSAHALATRGYTALISGLLAADEDLVNGLLAYAVRAVAAGKIFYGPGVQTVLVDQWGKPSRKRASRGAAGLTERQLEVARLAAAGTPRSVIANRMHLSPGTVKQYLRVIRAHLGVTDPQDHAQLRRRLEDAGGYDDPGSQPLK